MDASTLFPSLFPVPDPEFPQDFMESSLLFWEIAFRKGQTGARCPCGDCSPGGMFLKRLSVLLKKFPVMIFDFPRRMDRQIREAGERAGEEGFSTATASRNHPTTVNLLLGSRSILKEERKCRSCVRKIRAKPAPGCADMKKG